MTKNVMNFLEDLIIKVNPLGLHLFATHYSNVLTTGQDSTIIPFDDLEQLQNQASLSCLKDAAKSLLDLRYFSGKNLMCPIHSVNVDFGKQTIVLKSDINELIEIGVSLDVLNNLVRLSELSSLDQYVYLNLTFIGDDPKKWDIQKIKQCYDCTVDNDTFVSYFLDLSISLVKKTLNEPL